jgi:hypothetical protein
MSMIERAQEAIARRTRYKWSRVNVVLIVSTGRTGTEFLAKFFARNFKGVDARHEPPMDMFELGAGILRGKYTPETAEEYFYSHRYELLKEVIDANNDFYIESNLNQSLVLDVAEKVFPNLKIIHVIRDPKTCIKSYYNKSPDDSGKLYFMGEGDFRERIVPEDFPGDAYSGKTASMNRFEKVCWYWAKYNSVAADYCEKHPENSIRVKYEDIFLGQNKNGEISKLIRFIGLEDRMKFSPDEVFKSLDNRSNASRHGELIGDYDTWTTEMKASFHAMLDAPMARFGY